jgi:multidrug resistance efflux pump
MAVLLLLAYAAICVVVFKLLRVPVNRWSVTTAAVSGVVVVGGLLLGMNYNHPFATDGRLFFYTTPIVPTVQGHVVEVAVEPNVPVKQGDLLFRIDPRPYQYAVDQKKAQLAEAEQNVHQLKASFTQAEAAVKKAQGRRSEQ